MFRTKIPFLTGICSQVTFGFLDCHLGICWLSNRYSSFGEHQYGAWLKISLKVTRTLFNNFFPIHSFSSTWKTKEMMSKLSGSSLIPTKPTLKSSQQGRRSVSKFLFVATNAKVHFRCGGAIDKLCQILLLLPQVVTLSPCSRRQKRWVSNPPVLQGISDSG